MERNLESAVQKAPDRLAVRRQGSVISGLEPMDVFFCFWHHSEFSLTRLSVPWGGLCPRPSETCDRRPDYVDTCAVRTNATGSWNHHVWYCRQESSSVWVLSWWLMRCAAETTRKATRAGKIKWKNVKASDNSQCTTVSPAPSAWCTRKQFPCGTIDTDGFFSQRYGCGFYFMFKRSRSRVAATSGWEMHPENRAWGMSWKRDPF